MTQQEYFVNSKIKDSNGNLLKVYHASNQQFKSFDMKYIGSGSGGANYGKGFYFTTNQKYAKQYGKYVNEYYLT